jgi:hypothetical protein
VKCIFFKKKGFQGKLSAGGKNVTVLLLQLHDKKSQIWEDGRARNIMLERSSAS